MQRDDIAKNRREYYLLEDSTLERLPKHVTDLIRQSFIYRQKDKSDILAILVLAIALESGYSPQLINTTFAAEAVSDDHINYTQAGTLSFNKHFLEQNTKLPMTFWQFDYENNEKSYNTLLKLTSLNVDCKLYITQLAQGLCVILTPLSIDSSSTMESNLMDQDNNNDNAATTSNSASTIADTKPKYYGRSTFLPISKYIPLKINIQNPGKSFRNLNYLSIQLKNEIFLPIRNSTLSSSECNFPYPSLLGIPIECLKIIMKYLVKNSKLALSRTCKQLNNNCKNC